MSVLGSRNSCSDTTFRHLKNNFEMKNLYKSDLNTVYITNRTRSIFLHSSKIFIQQLCFQPPPLFPKPHQVWNTRLFSWRIHPVYLQLSTTLFIPQWCHSDYAFVSPSCGTGGGRGVKNQHKGARSDGVPGYNGREFNNKLHRHWAFISTFRCGGGSTSMPGPSVLLQSATQCFPHGQATIIDSPH